MKICPIKSLLNTGIFPISIGKRDMRVTFFIIYTYLNENLSIHVPECTYICDKDPTLKVSFSDNKLQRAKRSIVKRLKLVTLKVDAGR